jgi:CBS domain-containing protein
MSRHLWEGGEVMLTRVAEVMSTTVITVPASTGVVEAAKPMLGRDKDALPIVDGERVVGIVTDRDIIADVVARGRDVTTMTVDEIGTFTPDASIEEALAERARRDLDRLVVVAGEQIVRIISKADSAPTTTTMTSRSGQLVPASCRR